MTEQEAKDILDNATVEFCTDWSLYERKTLERQCDLSFRACKQLVALVCEMREWSFLRRNSVKRRTAVAKEAWDAETDDILRKALTIQ